MLRLSCLVLLLMFTSSNSNAQTFINCVEKRDTKATLDEYMQFLSEMKDYLSKQYAPDCPEFDEIKDKSHLIIMFDGGGAYRPKLFEFRKSLSELKVPERHSYLYRTGYQQQIYHEILIKEDNKKFADFSLLASMQDVQVTEDQLVLYYSHDMVKKAYRCFESMIKLNPKLNVNLIGYSFGGDSVIRFAKKMKKNNQEIDQIMTIDPVRKGLGSIKNITSNKDVSFFKKPINAKKHYNYYQKRDKGSLNLTAIKINIKGNIVQDADLNLEINPYLHTPPDIDLSLESDLQKKFRNGFEAHKRILYNPVILKATKDFFSREDKQLSKK